MKEAAQLSRRIGAEQLGIPLNDRFGGRLVMRRDTSLNMPLGNFMISVVGPTPGQLRELRKKWVAWLRTEKGRRQIRAVKRDAQRDEDLLANGQLEAFLRLNLLGPAIGNRTSVTEQNVASIVMLVEEGNQNVLLTGDARDDHVVEALIDSGHADADGRVHLNVLKAPAPRQREQLLDRVREARHGRPLHPLRQRETREPGHPGRQAADRFAPRPGITTQLEPEVGNRFKLWFSADEHSPNADSAHMREIEHLVRQRAAASRGQMRFRFNRGRSFSFAP